MTFPRCVRCDATFHSTKTHEHQCAKEQTNG